MWRQGQDIRPQYLAEGGHDDDVGLPDADRFNGLVSSQGFRLVDRYAGHLGRDLYRRRSQPVASSGRPVRLSDHANHLLGFDQGPQTGNRELGCPHENHPGGHIALHDDHSNMAPEG